MVYRCDQAVIGGAREPIRCKVSGTVCAHQKMCMMEGRIVLTDGAMRCPGRDAETMAAAAAAEPETVPAAGLERVELAAADDPEMEDDLDLIPEDEPEVMLTDVEILPAGYTGPSAKNGKAGDLPEPETVPAAAAEPEKKPGRKAAVAKSGKTGAKKSSGKK